MTKIRTPFIYKLGKIILGPIFMHHYKPEIVGLENIPDDGPIIFAGNHIHLYDQCITILKYKRFITYMAKKEYFDSWKTKWFFSSAGCIPVDRSKKDNNSVEKALNVLNNGYPLGIFPEGTRNALKDKDIKKFYDLYFKKEDYREFSTKLLNTEVKVSQLDYLTKLYNTKVISLKELKSNFFNVDEFLKDLLKQKKITKKDYADSLFLELKYGAVSLAKKTNALIVPVIITGKYHKNSKFKVIYGKPIKVDDDLEKANQNLRKRMIELALKNLDSTL